MKMIYQLHLHLNSGRVASLRPCDDFAVETMMDQPRIRSVKLMGHMPHKTGQRYALIESIDLSEVQYIEVELLGEIEDGNVLDVSQ